MHRRWMTAAAAASLIAWSVSTACGPTAETGHDDEGQGADGRGTLAIVGATVIHDPAEPALDDATVVVRDGRVAALGPRDQVDVPQGSRLVNGDGAFLIPGLWDMHVHLTDATELAAPVLLANGVTGVRDMGGDFHIVADMERRRRAGDLSGPRIFTSGPYVDGPKPGLPYRITVETARDGRAAADSVRALGADFIKVHNDVPALAYFALLDRASELALPVAGHVPLEVDPAAAARAGQASLEHFVTLFEGTLRTQTSGIEALESYLETGLDTLVGAIAATDAYLSPTAYAYLLRARRGELADRPDERLRYVARSLRDQWDAWFPVQERDRDPRIAELRKEFYRLGLRVVGRFHDAGVPILAGTDLAGRDILPGFHLHEELNALVGAGLTPAEALATATTVPARFLHADSLGAIAVDHRADLVLLDADPRQDIGNTRHIRAVVADGRYYDREGLDGLLARAAEVADEY